jgi:hypothetical protein
MVKMKDLFMISRLLWLCDPSFHNKGNCFFTLKNKEWVVELSSGERHLFCLELTIHTFGKFQVNSAFHQSWWQVVSQENEGPIITYKWQTPLLLPSPPPTQKELMGWLLNPNKRFKDQVAENSNQNSRSCFGRIRYISVIHITLISPGGLPSSELLFDKSLSLACHKKSSETLESLPYKSIHSKHKSQYSCTSIGSKNIKLCKALWQSEVLQGTWQKC